MTMSDVVHYHLREALQAGLTEMGDDCESARCLHAETKMRLISMSQEDLWELAVLTCTPTKAIEQVYTSLINRVEELRNSAKEWMKDLESYNDYGLEAGEEYPKL